MAANTTDGESEAEQRGDDGEASEDRAEVERLRPRPSIVVGEELEESNRARLIRALGLSREIAPDEDRDEAASDGARTEHELLVEASSRLLGALSFDDDTTTER